MDEHRFYAFHRKIYCLGCHHCMSPVPLHVNEAPAHLDRPMIPLYPILPGSEKQMNTSFKVLLRRHSNYHYYIRFSKHNVLYTQYDWLLFSTVIKLPLSVITAVQIWTGYEHVAHGWVYSLSTLYIYIYIVSEWNHYSQDYLYMFTMLSYVLFIIWMLL